MSSEILQTSAPEPIDSTGSPRKFGVFDLRPFGITAVNFLGGILNIVKESLRSTYKITRSIVGIHCPIPQPPPAAPRDVFLCCRRLVDKQAVYGPINVMNSHDKQFFRLMKRAYKSLRGSFGWISFREIARFRFVKFQPFYKIHVSCSETDQLPKRGHQEYEIDYPVGYVPDSLPFKPPIAPEILLYFYNNPGCADSIEKLLRFIPKRIVNNPNPPDEAWGLYAEEGLSMGKFLMAGLVIAVLSTIFIGLWLFYHPGDLQNAFTPMFVVSVVGALLVAPEFMGYGSKKKRS
ncbi:uncharacterized protein DFL_007101 [Arthrobotrys flagrans]|uniref:Uncharacterized protein n=1 Tax=Arthrobotrys flagrans TaxID=97331 RepID=A0A436ZVB2_ARTFL|nr:hypothetical protein DFL_007101 [Arthrobotrys flagrans]